MKILSISNNLLSLNNANGKFCRNYLNAFFDNELASFYISSDIKTDDERIESFNYTDADVLNDFLRKKKKDKTIQSTNNQKVNKRSAIVRVLRYLIWRIAFRRNKKFYEWIDTIKPTHIVVTVGDNPFLLFLARKLKRKTNSKLIIICGENYSLKKHDYLKRKYHRNASFLLFQKVLRQQTRKCFKQSDLVIFNSDSIMELYEKKMKFNKSVVVYPLSTNKYIDEYDYLNKDIVYAGNLGIGRAEALITFSKVLNSIDSNRTIKVYGRGAPEQIELLNKVENIEYKGIVTNDELIGIINKSWLLLHVESFDEYRKIDLKYAFSTKLSDLIASNNRFFMFAPDCYVESQFFMKNLENHIASDETKLATSLLQLIAQQKPFMTEDLTELRNKMGIIKNGKYIKELIEKL